MEFPSFVKLLLLGPHDTGSLLLLQQQRRGIQVKS